METVESVTDVAGALNANAARGASEQHNGVEPITVLPFHMGGVIGARFELVGDGGLVLDLNACHLEIGHACGSLGQNV